MITIREATKPDAALIADLSRQTFYESFAAFNTKDNMDKFLNEQFTHELLMAEVGAPRNVFLLAYDEQIPVGYARLRENNNPPQLRRDQSIEIARIYVVADRIGRGLGNLLMRQSINIAVQKNHDTIWLGVWEHNQRAIDFYKRWGFEKFAEHDFILGDDIQKDWLMKKTIGGTANSKYQ